ncbi:MAG TPA: beta-ketoacyl-ACP synthase III [Verrucomicrobiae bacterium]|nr:beta-ketoacyl-ACP synthase III [Verrucomicrobiae bacterium]
MSASRILGIGHYLPPKVVTNFDLMKMMETSNEFIVERTGVHKRRHAEPDQGATDLAAIACRAAVKDAGLTMDQIDLVIMNTITPDHADPGSAYFLQSKLGMEHRPALEIRAQCAGIVYGMAIAESFIASGMYRHILIVCSEVLSKRMDGSYDGRNIAILLGDGAGALVVGPAKDGQPGILSSIMHTDGGGAKVLYTAAPGSALGRPDMINAEDIESGRIHFRMLGKEMFQNGVLRMTEAVFEALEKNGLRLDDIDVLIPHQANLRMLEAVVEKVGIAKEKVFVNVDQFGNMASACLPIALYQARESGMVKPGSLVLLVAFGSGFVWGSTLLRL